MIKKISSQIAVTTPSDYYEIYGGKVTSYLHQSPKDNSAIVSIFSNTEDALVRNFEIEPVTEFSFKNIELAKKFHEILSKAKKSNKFDYQIIINDLEGMLDIERFQKILGSFIIKR